MVKAMSKSSNVNGIILFLLACCCPILLNGETVAAEEWDHEYLYTNIVVSVPALKDLSSAWETWVTSTGGTNKRHQVTVQSLYKTNYVEAIDFRELDWSALKNADVYFKEVNRMFAVEWQDHSAIEAIAKKFNCKPVYLDLNDAHKASQTFWQEISDGNREKLEKALEGKHR